MTELEARLASLLPEPTLLFLAGPNGAGKSTIYAKQLSRLGHEFVNADVIAKQLEATVPDLKERERIGQQRALARQKELLAQRTSFCMETVFSDPVGDKLDFLKSAQARGYSIFMVFIGIGSAMLSQARVIRRVQEGGHDVPDDRIRDRYPRTLNNLRQAVTFVDEAWLFDNSDPIDPYRLVAIYTHGDLKERGAFSPDWADGLTPK